MHARGRQKGDWMDKRGEKRETRKGANSPKKEIDCVQQFDALQYKRKKEYRLCLAINVYEERLAVLPVWVIHCCKLSNVYSYYHKPTLVEG